MDATFLRASIIFEAGDPNRALPIFHRIIEHVLLTEWGIARVVLHSKKLTEAVRRLHDVATEFEQCGMVTYAVLETRPMRCLP